MNRLKTKWQRLKNSEFKSDRIHSVSAEIEFVRSKIESLKSKIIEQIKIDIKEMPEPFYHLGKISRHTVANSPNLSLAIRDRILDSDLVIIISGSYDQHREWMQFECNTARDKDLPVIAIIPPGHENKPIEMRHYANWIIKWDPAAIKNTISKAQQKIVNNILD